MQKSALDLLAIAFAVVLSVDPAVAQVTWQGLVIEPEDRCTPYRRSDYPYQQSIEDDLLREYGYVYSPYTGQYFESDKETDIEHMVAVSEAHDSGLCGASKEIRSRFANDLLNLTFADPDTNRRLKSGKDAARWLPEENRCWFADRVIQVKRKYALSVDQEEKKALQNTVVSCRNNFDMYFTVPEVLERSDFDPLQEARNIVEESREMIAAEVEQMTAVPSGKARELKGFLKQGSSAVESLKVGPVPTVETEGDQGAAEKCEELKLDWHEVGQAVIAIRLRYRNESACILARP